MKNKLRDMAVPQKALLFLLCALVPLGGAAGLILLAKPTRAAGETPGTPQYYNARLEDAKEAVNWLPAGSYGGVTVTNPGPWKLGLDLGACSAPWSGGSAVPTVGAGTAVSPYEVATAEQFRYCVVSYKFFKLMKDIDLGGYLGRNWLYSTASTIAYTADGNGHTVYNYYNSISGSSYSLFGNHANLTIQDLRISNAYSNSSGNGGIFISGTGTNDVKISNCAAENILMYSTSLGIAIYAGYAWGTILIENSYAVNCHTVCIAASGTKSCNSIIANNAGGVVTIRNTFAIGCSVIGNKGHNGGFVSCGSDYVIENCFCDVNVYGYTDAGTFGGVAHGGASAGLIGTHQFTNCFASGKVEGISDLGAFVGTAAGWNSAYVNMSATRCYSTAAVGILNEATRVGGMFGSMRAASDGVSNTLVLNCADCYAAGEIGSLNTDVSAGRSGGTQNTGGFYGLNNSNGGAKTYTNCYYDKQTTAMREWETGPTLDGGPGDVAGITGVLTTDTAKAGVGLTSAPGAAGFTGFSDDSQWVFEPDHYPQLKVFADTAAIEANFTNTFWMTRGELTNLVKAYSRASTSTVKLETWETGYDGVTALPANTYDTVRDVMLDFGMTRGADTAWYRVGKGPTLASGTGNTVEINGQTLPVLRLTPAGGAYGGQYRARELQPGVEWLRVNAKLGSQVGTRALRVVPTSGLAAGPNAALVRGVVDTYDHREGVRLSYSTGPDMVASPPKPINEMVFKSATTDFIDIDVPTQLELELGDTLPPGKLHVRVSPLAGYASNGDPILGTPLALTNTAADPLSKQLNGEIPVLLTGRYVVEYFWVMDDGRYMWGQKLMDLSSAVKNARVSEDGGDTWKDWDNGLADEPVTVRTGDWIEYEIAVDYAGREVPKRVIDERVFQTQTTQ